MKTVSKGKNHKAINIGAIDSLSDYSFVHPKLGHTVENKLFIGELLEATGSEISFMELPARTTIDFLHKHKKHEEIYIFLKGNGQYQVDGEVFSIEEGSIVRVSPEGSRVLSNTSDEKMIYLVVQSVAESLAGYNIADGFRVQGEIKMKQE